MSLRVSTFRLLFPPVCALCGEDLPVWRTDRLCDGCHDELGLTEARRCRRCGGVLGRTAISDQACGACRGTRFQFDRAVALGPYQGALRSAVIRMKHAGERYLSCAIADLLAAHVAGELPTDRPELLVPVPMHWWRRLRRGGSSAEMLAERVGERLHIPVASLLLRCRRNPKKQSTLAPADRRKNVAGAYAALESYDLGGAHVGLVDDTLTTGATANELTRLLRDLGAQRVTVLVVARATGGVS